MMVSIKESSDDDTAFDLPFSSRANPLIHFENKSPGVKTPFSRDSNILCSNILPSESMMYSDETSIFNGAPNPSLARDCPGAPPKGSCGATQRARIRFTLIDPFDVTSTVVRGLAANRKAFVCIPARSEEVAMPRRRR